jgi:multidrug resistance efflux pump
MHAGHLQGEATQVVFVDRALWLQLARATTTEDFARAWLALQCSMLGNVRSAVVVYGEPECGPFRKVASFPDGPAPGDELSALCQESLETGEPRIVEPAARSGEDLAVAYPLRVDGRAYGVVGMQLRPGADSAAILRHLQWGAAWLDGWVRREHAHDEQQIAEQLMAVLDLVATALSHERFDAAAAALATETATRLKCDRVSVGMIRNGQCEVAALSHSAQRDARMNLLRAIGAAMDEACDQKSVLRYPEVAGAAPLVYREHERLVAEHGNGAVLTIPLSSGDDAYGALLLERPKGELFTDADTELCKSVALALGPMLGVKRRHDRSAARKLLDALHSHATALFGPRHLQRKIAVGLIAALAAVLVFGTGEYRVSADATVEGSVRRVVTAPVDGYLATVEVRPGDTVTAGQLLSSFDDRDLTLERLQVTSERSQLLARVQEASARGARAEAQVISAQIRQSEAQLALLEEQLARMQVRAPWDALVVGGDLSQSLGAPLQRGASMFELAPLDGYRVVLDVDEHDIAELAPGQRGTLVLAALPSAPLEFEVRRVTPVATVADGSNVFRVEADLSALDERVRPGMRGVAKVAIDERRLIVIWTHEIVRWLRLRLWSWLP